MSLKKLFPLFFFSFLFIREAYAHCPLCTIGAAAAAGGAAYLGVSQIVIGLFIGAFAVSIGWWVSRLIKKKYIPFQKTLIVLFSFFTTILPLLAFMESIYPFYISWAGEYGSLLNRTYILNIFLVGSIIGGIIVCITPWMSSQITKLRHGKMIPFQGVILTLSLLLVIGGIIQLI